MIIKARISRAYIKENPNCQTYSAGGMKCTKHYRDFDMSPNEIETMKAATFTVTKLDEKTKKNKTYKLPIIEIKKDS